MKIHILYKFQESPWGGGNQFLKALKRRFEKQRVYEEKSERASVIFFNSHHNLDEVFRLKAEYPQKIFIHRIDGPIQLVRGKDEILDKIIFQFNNLVADGVVFQSNWSKKQNKESLQISSKYEIVVHNVPDNTIFNKIGKGEFDLNSKIKLIATSWSLNWRKGFEIYRFLDENLDFSKYEMVFVGNSPIEYKNIKWIKPVPREELAEVLKQNDIYITASQNDPCSNSLVEALSCGLPAIALNEGGHPELIQNGGELFAGEKDVAEKIQKVTKNYHYYQYQIPEFSIKKAAKDYYEFAKRIYDDIQNEQYKAKQVNLSTKVNFCKMKLMILKWKAKNKLAAIRRKTWKKSTGFLN